MQVAMLGSTHPSPPFSGGWGGGGGQLRWILVTFGPPVVLAWGCLLLRSRFPDWHLTMVFFQAALLEFFSPVVSSVWITRELPDDDLVQLGDKVAKKLNIVPDWVLWKCLRSLKATQSAHLSLLFVEFVRGCGCLRLILMRVEDDLSLKSAMTRRLKSSKLGHPEMPPSSGSLHHCFKVESFF